MMWKRQVEEHTEQIGLKRGDATDRMMWRSGVDGLSRKLR